MNRHGVARVEQSKGLGGAAWIEMAGPQRRAPAPYGQQRDVEPLGEVGQPGEDIGVPGEVDPGRTAFDQVADRRCSGSERRSEAAVRSVSRGE